jgi:hypothetical protein
MKTKHPNHHSTRIIEKFLWIPITIKTWCQDSGETRWLESVKIEQKCYVNGSGIFGYQWKNERFI